MPHGVFHDPRTAAVLVVDDLASSRALMRTMLSGLDVEIAEAADGAAAFELLLERRFDLVITDLNMSPIDGGRLVLAAGLLSHDRRPKTMICSADSHGADAAQRLALQMADKIVPKPITAPSFVSAVCELLR